MTTTTTPPTSSPDETRPTEATPRPRRRGRPKKARGTTVSTISKIKADAVLDWMRPRLLLVHTNNPSITNKKAFYRAFVQEFKINDLSLSAFVGLARKAGFSFSQRIVVSAPTIPSGVSVGVLSAASGEAVGIPKSPTLQSTVTAPEEDPIFDNEISRPNALTTR